MSSASLAQRLPTKKRQPKQTGGAGLAEHNSREAKRLAAAILEVLAGMRTPTQAAQALALSVPRYYQIEARALRGLVAACEPRPKGRQPSAAGELAELRQQNERLQRELNRQQSMVRLAQRTVGLAAAVPDKSTGKKRRKRRPSARALAVAQRLREDATASRVSSDSELSEDV
jgi:hypothetical protein